MIPTHSPPERSQRFSDDGYIFERKFDWDRCLVFSGGLGVQLLSRSRKVLNGTYPEHESALEKIAEHRFIAGGEIIAFDGEITSFSRLQKRMQIRDRVKAGRSTIAVYLYLFDMMYLDGSTSAPSTLSRGRRS